MTWFLWTVLLFVLWRWHHSISALNKTCDAFDDLVKTHEALAKSHDELCETMEMMLEADSKC